MPPKAKIAAPIDRPLSKAYVREFTGWATAEPPGISDPTSFRIMENVAIHRDGSAGIRPGLRYLSYEVAPRSAIGDPIYEGLENPLVARGLTMAASSVTQIAFPAGTAVGDVFTIIGHDGNSGGRMQLLPDGYFNDPRVIQVNEHFSATEAWGYVTDLSDLTVLGEPTVSGKIHLCTFGPPAGETLSWGEDWTTDGVSDDDSTGGTDVNAPSFDTAGVVMLETLDIGTGHAMTGFTDYATVGSPITGDEIITLNHIGTNPSTPIVWSSADAYQLYDRGLTALPVYQITGYEPVADIPGIAFDRPFVGTHEPFYLNDGTKAYLLAVREEDETVGFRVLVLDENSVAMYDIEDPLIDFEIVQTREILNFSSGTTYVKYLQIDNKIFALSDNGENMRMFTVGETKQAKALTAITRPEWTNEDKLDVVHPEADWITNGEPIGTRRNRITNPSFENNLVGWHEGANTRATRPASPSITPESGERAVKLESRPERTNLAASPLHDVPSFSVDGWTSGPSEGSGLPPNWIGDDPTDVEVTADGDFLKARMPARKGLHYAKTRLLEGVEAGTRYQVAFDYETGAHVDAKMMVRWFGINGAQVASSVKKDVEGGTIYFDGTRWISGGMVAPKGAVSMRLYLGGENLQKDLTNVWFKKVMISPSDESMNLFTGSSGAYYFWTGPENNSASVYHPPANISYRSDKVPVRPTLDLCGSIYAEAAAVARSVTLTMRMFNKNNVEVEDATDSATDTAGSMVRLEAGETTIPNNATQADLRITIPNVERGEYHFLDAAMIEGGITVADTYFDGSTPDVPTDRNSWLGAEHASASKQEEFLAGATIPTAETKTADTLIASGGAVNNPFSFGFFYTFSNEVGESASSRIRVVRTQRAWSEWVWALPNAAGEPDPANDTSNPLLCADQLVAIIPEDVFDEAMAMGAIEWSLYMFTWSEQEPAPVVAMKVGEKELPLDADYDTYGWIQVTPDQSVSITDAMLPTADNLYNYSDPSRGGQGLVAADRMTLVNDPTAAAVIRWSSNRLGEYTNFTASRGGGYKTLTSGNLFVPAVVKLWQNPQSADTLWIGCLGTDGMSSSYYMAPAQVASQSEAVNVMGFEETTATPGTTSPYGVEVFNNSLYHPLDDQLMKSTASNYNINHKSQTDPIRDMWEKLVTKYWIMSSVHDSRLYYIVNNPEGDPLEENCKGNEIWVFDAQAKNGTWSRFKIQAHALRKIEFGGQVYMSVIRPDGVYYLDPAYGRDDVIVDDDLEVGSQAIPWKIESNTQGANRAHDAWCYLKQVSVQLGYFQGRMRYGIRSVDRHGHVVEKSKIFKDFTEPTDLSYDVQDFLQIERDLQEWFFYAESLVDDEGVVEDSYGQINLVQYRYTPSSVNTGGALGSVETFEYGRDAAQAASTTSDNGIPLPLLDSRRP